MHGEQYATTLCGPTKFKATFKLSSNLSTLDFAILLADFIGYLQKHTLFLYDPGIQIP